MKTDQKQQAAKSIKALVTSLNENIETAKLLGLEVEFDVPAANSLREANIAVMVYEKIKF